MKKNVGQWNSNRWFVIFVAILLLFVLTACSGSDWEEKNNLGLKYLEEGKYQEAIIAFSEAIDIDDKQPLPYVGRGDAYILLDESFDEAMVNYETALSLDDSVTESYLGIADIYIRKGTFDKALEILNEGLLHVENADIIRKKIDEINTGVILDSEGNSRMTVAYDEEGTLLWYHLKEYRAGRLSKVTLYNKHDQIIDHLNVSYNNEGREMDSYFYDYGSGELYPVSYNYDESGRLSMSTCFFGYEHKSRVDMKYFYDENGLLKEREEVTAYYRSEFETSETEIYYEGEKCIRQEKETFTLDDEMRSVLYYEYGEDGMLKKQQWQYYYDDLEMVGPSIIWEYDEDGRLTSLLQGYKNSSIRIVSPKLPLWELMLL